MRVTAALKAVVLAGVIAIPGSAISGLVPWPTANFDRRALPAGLDFYRYVELDRGAPFLDRSSFATLGAPQLLWVLLVQRAERESWTAAQLEENWGPFVADWEMNLNIFFNPRSSELANTRAGGTGNLVEFILKSSTGYRKVIRGDDLPARTPKYNDSTGLYENSYRLVFDRPQTLAPGTRWLRLYVITAKSLMRFEWAFGAGSATKP